MSKCVRQTYLVFAVLLFGALTTRASAQVQPASPVFLVNLAVPESGFGAVRASTLDQALADMLVSSPPPGPNQRPVVFAPGDRLTALVSACKPTDDGTPPPATPLVKRLYACADCVNAYRETRFISSRGDTALFLVIYDANVIPDNRVLKAFFNETSRESELIATGTALLKLTRKESGALAQPPREACLGFTHTLQYKRSHMKVSLTNTAAVEAPSPPAVPGTAASTPSGLLVPPSQSTKGVAATMESTQVVVGPVERWFFSADFSIEKASIELAKTPEVPKEAIKSKDFFIGLNMAFADLLTDRESTLQRRSWYKELVLKFQVTPSKEPWSAWGIGLGLRGYRIRTILWNMDVVHPYFAVGRQSVDGGASKVRLVAGLGFDPRSLQR